MSLTLYRRCFCQALLLSLVLHAMTITAHAQQIDTTYTDQGKVKEITFTHAHQTRFIEFDATGKNVVAIRHEGKFNGCNMAVGTDSLFDKNRSLFKTVAYDNRKSETEEGCSATWTAIETKCYYKNGTIKSVSFEKTCYECATCACGEWTTYNKKGKVIQTVNNGDCYNQTPCAQ